jgi:hypothetical protein
MALFTDDIAPTDAVALNVEPSVHRGKRFHKVDDKERRRQDHQHLYDVEPAGPRDSQCLCGSEGRPEDAHAEHCQHMNELSPSSSPNGCSNSGEFPNPLVPPACKVMSDNISFPSVYLGSRKTHRFRASTGRP